MMEQRQEIKALNKVDMVLMTEILYESNVNVNAAPRNRHGTGNLLTTNDKAKSQVSLRNHKPAEANHIFHST